MRPFIKIFTVTLVLSGIVMASYADRGITRRAKKKVSVHIPVAAHTIKKDMPQSGLTGVSYKGSYINNCEDECNPQPSNHYLMTYQKGNSVFIVPVRSKVSSSVDGENTLPAQKLLVRPS